MEWNSFLMGTIGGIILVVIAILALLWFIFGKFKDKLVKVLQKHYSKWSIFLVLVISIAELADLTQTVLGLSLSLAGMVGVILIQLVTTDKALMLGKASTAKKGARIVKNVLLGFIAGLVIATPTALLGLLMAALGLAGKITKN